MDDVIGQNESSQHPRRFKEDGYIPKEIEVTCRRQEQNATEHRCTLRLGFEVEARPKALKGNKSDLASSKATDILPRDKKRISGPKEEHRHRSSHNII